MRSHTCHAGDDRTRAMCARACTARRGEGRAYHHEAESHVRGTGSLPDQAVPTTHTASCLVKYAKECKEMAAGANIAHATDVVASQKMCLG